MCRWSSWLLALGLMASAPAWSSDDGIPFGKNLTLEEMQTIASKIDNRERKEAMQSLLKVCSSKEFLLCHMGMYDLSNYGLVRAAESKEENPRDHFPGDVRSNRVLMSVQAAMQHPSLASHFQIQVSPLFEEFGLPKTMEYAVSAFDSHSKELGIRMVENHYRALRVPVNMRVNISKRRGEAIRMLTYGFALRGDAKNAYQGLELLKKYAKMGTRRDAWVVNHTHESVVKLLNAMAAQAAAKAQKPKKPTDEVKGIEF